MTVAEFCKPRPKLIDLVTPTDPYQYNPKKYMYAAPGVVSRPTEDLVIGRVYKLPPDKAFASGIITPTQKRVYDIEIQLAQSQKPGRPTKEYYALRRSLLAEREQLEEILSERR